MKKGMILGAIGCIAAIIAGVTVFRARAVR